MVGDVDVDYSKHRVGMDGWMRVESVRRSDRKIDDDKKKRDKKDQGEGMEGMAKVSLYGRATIRNMGYNSQKGMKGQWERPKD